MNDEILVSVIASDFEEEFDFSKTTSYQAPTRPTENPVLSPLNEEQPKEEDQDDIDVTSILPGFLSKE